MNPFQNQLLCNQCSFLLKETMACPWYELDIIISNIKSIKKKNRIFFFIYMAFVRFTWKTLRYGMWIVKQITRQSIKINEFWMVCIMTSLLADICNYSSNINSFCHFWVDFFLNYNYIVSCHISVVPLILRYPI